jgi:acyl-CoA synthetase (AMP-forming)/AMP-acid ligase II
VDRFLHKRNQLEEGDVSEAFNAAEYFVDRHVKEGRGARVAIECGDERVTYADLFERVNRFGSALRGALDVRPEERGDPRARLLTSRASRSCA